MSRGTCLDRMPEAIRQIIARLNGRGYEAYVVGGCVRDALLGREPHDWDVCTSALPQEVVDSFPERTVHPTGIQHGTVLVSWEGEGVEITTFRTEGDYSDHRHPDRVTFVRSLEEDLSRRDFTVNAMAYHPERGVTDPFGGQADLRSGLIRCVGDPVRRFQEDGLRILRALRFAARYGFAIEERTAKAMEECRELLRWIAVERIFQELKGILCGAGTGELLRRHREIAAVCLPELRPAFDFEQHNPNHCYDVWEHTLHAVDNIAPDPVLRLAMLFHDIGKPATFSLDENGVGHCYRHHLVSARIAEDVLRRMRCDNETREAVVTLVDYHDRYRRFPRRTTGRLLSELGAERTRQLLQVIEADIKAQNPDSVPMKMERLLEGYAMVEALLAAGSCLSVRDLAIGGRDLIALGGRPGIRFGQVLDALFRQVLDGTLENRREPLLAAAKVLLEEES